MKKNKLFLCALASGMLALTGCSDSTDLGQAGGNGANWNADGTGYVSLAINLPTTSASMNRAGTDNDQFEDGTPNEYAVKSAILCLFVKGADDAENNYVFEGAYNLPLNFNNYSDTPNQITSTARITKKIASIAETTVKALVILNPDAANISTNNDLSVEADPSSNSLTIKESGVDKTYAKGNLTFGALKAKTQALGLNAGNFMMTNAPLVKKTTGSGSTTNSIVTLADVEYNKIARTPTLAAANPAATIYVERSVAKVTLENGATGGTTEFAAYTDKSTGSDLVKVYADLKGFDLDNTNKTSYIVRNDADYSNWFDWASNKWDTPTDAQKRFIGVAPVESGVSLYRSYFAKDVNYNSDATLDVKTYKPNETADPANDGINTTLSKSLYCMENTFDVEHQNHANTTRAIIKVQYKPNTGAYTPTTGEEDDYMFLNDPNNFCFGISALKTKLQEVIANMPAVQELYDDEEDVPDANIKAITLTDVNEKGLVTVKEFKVTPKTGSDITINSSVTEPKQVAAWKAVQNYVGNISKYTKGVGYYVVYIKHFGNELTPWNNGEGGITYTPVSGAPYYAATATEAGDFANQNYLGRYGVLRNNWYKLSVTGINKIATPVIPTPETDDWDDDTESYINVKINILSWAVRNQGVELQ